MSWSNRLGPDWRPTTHWFIQREERQRQPEPPAPDGMSMTDFVEELRRYLKCAICGTRVQRIDRNLNTLTVHCHGATESVTVVPSMIEAMTALDMVPAFGGKLLGAPADTP